MTQAEIDQAIKDQLGTNPDEPLPTNPDIEKALANYTAEAAIVADTLNRSLTDNYNVGFQNWAGQVLAGRIPNSNPPQPPPGYLAVKASDGWSYVIRGGQPVCPVPAIPQLPPPPPPIPEPDNVRNVPAGDTMPVGYILTAPDGTRWQKKGSPTPFGMAYYYLKVA
ncbi:MAG: hypothetical protein C5B51_08455 [Terriglobia bacterium]|nr:MAG: hypothetical protein C5B51_08455 [Terriglobia bacterium]